LRRTPITPTHEAKATNSEWQGRNYRRHDLRHDYRDLIGHYARVNAMPADIARDRARLNMIAFEGWSQQIRASLGCPPAIL